MDLSNVKVGDEVIVRHCGAPGQEMIEHTEVVKVAKTQVVIKDGTRFIKRNGYKVGEANKTRGWLTFLYTKEQFER